jgi:hypothetical protein
MSNSTKIRPVNSEFLHADGWTDGQTDGHDMTKLIVAFRSFADAAKNVCEENAEGLCDLKLKDISYTG